MTQEDKKLLLKDLAARFPYGVVLDVDTTDWRAPQGHIQVKIESYGVIFKDLSLIVNGSYYGDNYKPYLRPMSSMTDGEKEELTEEHKKDERIYIDVIERVANGDKHARGTAVPHFAADWCNEHHFDCRGLIEKGLAIAVTENNNPYKE